MGDGMRGGNARRTLRGASGLFPGPVNVGVRVEGGEAVLVDAGGDDSAGRKILRSLEEEGVRLALIVSTHSHADHIGGNAFLQRRTGCRIAATPPEAAILENPELEPFYLWSSLPPRPLAGKFLQAAPSRVTDRIAPEGPIPGTGLEAVPLPGHMIGMIGVRTPEGVLYCGDALLAPDVLEKYGVPFVVHIGQALESIRRIEALAADPASGVDWFVPSHGVPVGREGIPELAAANRSALEDLVETVASLCGEPRSRDALLEALAEARGIRMNLTEYVLLHGSLSAALAHLSDEGRVEARFEGGRTRFVRVP